MICLECKKDAKYYCRGMCHACYGHFYNKGYYAESKRILKLNLSDPGLPEFAVHLLREMKKVKPVRTSLTPEIISPSPPRSLSS